MILLNKEVVVLRKKKIESYFDENWMMLGIFISLARDIKRVTNKEKDEMYFGVLFLSA